MEFSGTNVITLVVALSATAATWGAVKWRIGRLEKDFETLHSRFEEKMAGLHSRIEEKMAEFQRARETQGERIGETEKDVAALFAGTEILPRTKRQRRLTKPSGEPIG